MKSLAVIAAVVMLFAAAGPCGGQQSYYNGTNVTGQLYLARTVDVLQAAQTLRMMGGAFRVIPEKPKPSKRLHPPLLDVRGLRGPAGAAALSTQQSLRIIQPADVAGFSGLTHLDQRMANGGRQFSVEPPNPSIAVGHGYILEGVNNAIQVYTTSGIPLLPTVLSSNELFGVPAAIDWSTGENGVYPTDMRVFYDHTIARWFVLQRAQDYDWWGNPMNRSHLYLAVSQTADPIGRYNIYEMDTTNAQNPACPCIADYPQIGADQYGFYVSVNEFDAYTEQFVDAAILAISKPGLLGGSSNPAAYRFQLPLATGFEFAIQPASTPPGASNFLSNGGVQYFVSSQASYSIYSGLAVWAMYNTASLGGPAPNPVLTRISVPTLTYYYPGVANQRDGPLPYGSSLEPKGALAYLDGGDTRILSLVYAGGRLYATLGTQVVDETGRSRVGGAYVMLSPTLRAGVLSARVLRQGYVVAAENHVLRPAIGVNARGAGAIAFTLVGPEYYPTAAYLPIDTASTATEIRIAGLGNLPEDGFTGYPGGTAPGIARWGDYSTAVTDGDGNIWMVAQYIPNAPRTEFANWGSFLWLHKP